MNPILEALDGEALTILESERSAIQGYESKVNSEVVTAVGGTIAKAIPSNGLAGLLSGGLKAAVIASEPTIEALLGKEEEALIDLVEDVLKKNAPAA